MFGAFMVTMAAIVGLTGKSIMYSGEQAVNRVQVNEVEKWIEREYQVFNALYDDKERAKLELIVGHELKHIGYWEKRASIYEVSLYEGWWKVTNFHPTDEDRERILKEFERKKNK